MSGDITCTGYEMATNSIVDNLKSLSLSQSENAYSTTVEHLTTQLKRAAPNGFADNMPLAMAIIDNLHRVIPIFDKKLLESNESSRQTNVFLETLVDLFPGGCLFNLFLEIKDTYCLETLFHRYIPLIKPSYFTNDNQYDRLVNCLLPIIAMSSTLISVTENDITPNLLSYLLDFAKQHLQSESRQDVINSIFTLMKVVSKTPALIPMMLRSEWPSTCIQWLKTTGRRPSFKKLFFNLSYFTKNCTT
jgi:hypothetical protein